MERLKSKCKAMQDEADENLRYKDEAAKGFGITQSDLDNKKKSVMSLKEQEKALEKAGKETMSSRQRFKGLQDELKELNRWKLHVQHNALKSGVDLKKLNLMQPVRESELPSGDLSDCHFTNHGARVCVLGGWLA